jgi:hypothetical protein
MISKVVLPSVSFSIRVHGLYDCKLNQLCLKKTIGAILHILR